MDGCRDWSWQCVRKAALRCCTCHPSHFWPGKAWVALLFHLLHPLHSLTHSLACTKKMLRKLVHTHTVKYTQSRRRWPLAIFSQFPSFICSWKAVFFQCLWKITEPRPTKGSKTIQKKWINNTMKQNLIKDLHGRFILCRSYTTWPRCISSPGLISRCYTGFVITSLI